VYRTDCPVGVKSLKAGIVEKEVSVSQAPVVEQVTDTLVTFALETVPLPLSTEHVWPVGSVFTVIA
jgi:hypothetical protein